MLHTAAALPSWLRYFEVTATAAEEIKKRRNYVPGTISHRHYQRQNRGQGAKAKVHATPPSQQGTGAWKRSSLRLITIPFQWAQRSIKDCQTPAMLQQSRLPVLPHNKPNNRDVVDMRGRPATSSRLCLRLQLHLTHGVHDEESIVRFRLQRALLLLNLHRRGHLLPHELLPCPRGQPSLTTHGAAGSLAVFLGKSSSSADLCPRERGETRPSQVPFLWRCLRQNYRQPLRVSRPRAVG